MLVDGTKYDICYRQVSGLDKGWIRQVTLYSHIYFSATPPVKRRPCLGRNINDSDADLYAEYHGNGNHGNNPHDNSSTLTDREDMEIQPVRQRNKVTCKTTVENRRNLFKNEPDLTSTINTNFSQISNTSRTLQEGDSFNSSVFSDSSVDISDSSVQGVGAVGQSPGGGACEEGSTSHSAGPGRGGFGFDSMFGQIYEEHRSAIEQSNMEEYNAGEHRARSWSAGNVFSYSLSLVCEYCKTLIIRVTLFSRNHRSSFIHETLFWRLVISSSIILTLQMIGEDFIFASLCQG